MVLLKTRTRSAIVDTLTTADIYEFLRLETGIDSATIASLQTASLYQAESKALQPIYGASYQDVLGGFSVLPTTLNVVDVRHSPSNVEVYYYAEGTGTRTLATILTQQWYDSTKVLTLTFDQTAIEENTNLEVEWTDNGFDDKEAADNYRKMAIAWAYDRDSEEMPDLTALLQRYARIF